MSKSPFSYTGEIKKAIYDFKYHNKPYYYKMFGSLLTDFMIKNNYTNFDYITSVPIHRSKEVSRGYNQAKLLSLYISDKLNIKYVDFLKRTVKTKKQSDLSKNERQKNIRGAFELKAGRDILKENSSILLVDDILTTGTTMDECCKVLLQAGASEVYGITIAR